MSETMFHCDKLCGEECCDVLRWALRFKDVHGVTCGGCTASPDTMQSALVSTCDPAKLAELLALALRARGFANPRRDNHSDYPDTIMMEWDTVDSVRSVGLAAHETRAAILAIMATPADESSRAECERIMQGKL